ncbi:YbhB/YbcL family Raf kinase inhibitor-like protein [Candidatus Pandoraea novymonadis]|nr:YbhB/YbcL family Raf kinase inhibitor-like protein [Candidatus Pandoraea novymonadis]
MKLWSNSFVDNGVISTEFAFFKLDIDGHVVLSSNKNPHLAWEDAPSGTQSFVIICRDVDAPTHGDDMNREGCEIPLDLPRVTFLHWVLVDVPLTVSEIAAASHSQGVTPRGKFGPEALDGLRHGTNDFTNWFRFSGDQSMQGSYYGYDGPCPPWNDARIHHYVFTLYALNIPKVLLSGSFDGHQVYSSIKSHVLAEASITGTYTLNPRLVR